MTAHHFKGEKSRESTGHGRKQVMSCPRAPPSCGQGARARPCFPTHAGSAPKAHPTALPARALLFVWELKALLPEAQAEDTAHTPPRCPLRKGPAASALLLGASSPASETVCREWWDCPKWDTPFSLQRTHVGFYLVLILNVCKENTV